MTKICYQCKQEKPLDAYNKNKKSKDGYSIRCKECRSKNRRKPSEKILDHRKEKWISGCIEKYGDEYDFSLVNYKDKDTKVSIICKKHDCIIYEDQGGISPFDFLWRNWYCEKCKQEEYNKQKTEVSKKRIIEKWGDKYNLDDYEYIDPKHCKGVRCKEHDNIVGLTGEIQRTGSIMNGVGCPICSENSKKEKNKEIYRNIFTEAINIKHEYKGYEYEKMPDCANEIIRIFCPIGDHGWFEQEAHTHKRGSGCSKCANIKRSRMLIKTGLNYGYNEYNYFIPYLESVLVDDFIPQYEIPSELSAYFVDFYIPKYNVVIEYDEDGHYEKRNIKKDKERQEYIEDKLGCEFIRIDDKKFMEDKSYAKAELGKVVRIRKQNNEDLFID
jgi:hypothetical protein